MTPQELAAEIREFIEAHARIRPDYDPEWEDPEERFTSPDASYMDWAADMLEKGTVPSEYIHSSWSGGGYSPREDLEAREWHDTLLEKIKKLQKED